MHELVLQHPIPERIEDEFGHGHFEVLVNSLTVGEVVPAFNVFNGFHSISLKETFPKQEFAKGKLVAAYRFGKRGMCSVLVNPDIFEVHEIDRHFTDFYRSDRQVVMREFKSKFYELQHIDAGRIGQNAVVISGRRKDSGQDVTVVVQFFPSSDEDWAKARK